MAYEVVLEFIGKQETKGVRKVLKEWSESPEGRASYERVAEEMRKQIAEAPKIEGWVARDKNGHLNFFLGVPRKIVNTKNDEYWIGHARMKAPNGFFPSVKWEDAEPTKCTLTIEI